MVVAVPSQLNATTILNAKIDQLKCWIDGVNSAAGKEAGRGKGKRVLTKEGKKADLQKKLAEHFKIDLSVAAATAPMPAGPLTVDKSIQKRQWSHLRALGREWHDSARAGHAFTLCPPDADADDDYAADGTSDASRPSRSQRAFLQEAEHVLSRLKGLAVRGDTMSARVVPEIDNSGALPKHKGGHVVDEAASALMGAALRGDATAANHLQQLLTRCVAAPSVLQPASAVPLRPSSQPLPSSHQSVPPPLPLPPPPPAASALASSPFGMGGLNARAMELAATMTPLPFYGARVGPWQPMVMPPACDAQSARAPVQVPLGGGMTDGSVRSPDLSVHEPLPAVVERRRRQPSHAPEPSTLRDAEVLDATQANIQQLQQAVDLRDVIKQVEDGTVRKMRELYGPPLGQRKAVNRVAWDRLKVTVNRHERLHEQLMDEFGGDKDRFFAFFAVEPRKLKKGGDTGRDLRPLRLVAEAIRHMSDDIRDEMQAQEYVDPHTGTFSTERWKERWGGANRWEIWRAIGKEYYGPPGQRSSSAS